MRHLLLSLSLASALGFPGPAMAAGSGDAVSNFEMILMIDGKKRADTWINLSENGTLIEIPASPVLSALASMIDVETIHRIEAQVTSKGTLTNKTLARFGVSVSINGPLRQVYLALTKNLAPAKSAAPPRASARFDSGKTAVIPSPKAVDDSGPWTTPPVPSLPGEVKLPRSKSDSVLLVDIGWEVGQTGDTADGKPPLSPAVNPPASVPGKVEGPAPPQVGAEKPTVQLQTFRLDRTRDELFEDVFKHKAPAPPAAVEVTLLVDGKSYGTLWINYSKDLKRYTFPADPVLNALQGLVKRELWEKLERRAKQQSRFTVEDLLECGFPTVLNTSVFELSTGVPAQLLGTKIHPMSGQRIDPYAVPAYEQAPFSSFMNFRLKERIPYYQYNPGPFDSAGIGAGQVEARNQQGRQPVTANFDGAVNLLTWVVEGKGILWEKPELNAFEVTRQELRLVHDWPKQAVRLSAGDLIFPTSGFQSFLSIGGIGLSRDFTLAPHLVAYPIKDLEFFLTSKSEVKVFINGTLRGTYQMDPGTQDLQGFPFTQGESEVEIQITDEIGQVQVINFSFIHEPSLLAKGKSAFSYNVGLPRRDTYRSGNLIEQPNSFSFMNYEYNPDHPVVFLDYRRGLLDMLTAEVYSQYMDTSVMVGAEALQALKIGKLKVGAAATYNAESEIDWAGNLEYTFIPKITADYSPISWRLRTEYLGPNFFRPGQDTGFLGSLTFGGSVQRNARIFDVNLSAAYTIRPSAIDFYSINAGVGRSWGKGWSSSLSMRNVFDRQRNTNTAVSASLNYYFNQGEHAVTASQRVENHVPDGTEKGTPPNWDNITDLAWDYNGSAPFPHNPILNATTSFGPRSNDYAGRAEWKGNQGTAEIYARRYEPKTTSIISNYADITLQTSLVFADWNFAFSRPVTNSFVMIKGIENESDCDILVNPHDMGYDAKSSPWLPGVIPNIGSYYLKKIHIEVLDPPFGAVDERTDYTLYPGYKSGYALYMGSNATIIALGTLLYAPGKPVEYESFTATSMDGENRDPVVGFTNGAGKFQLTRLQPGRYKIELERDGKAYTLVMTLPKKTSGIKSVGTLVLKER